MSASNLCGLICHVAGILYKKMEDLGPVAVGGFCHMEAVEVV